MCATYFLCRNLQGKEMRLLVILLTPIACKMKSRLFNMVCRLSQPGPKLLQKPHPLSLTSMYTVLLPHGISLVVWPYCCLSEMLASSFTWGAPTSMVLTHYIRIAWSVRETIDYWLCIQGVWFSRSGTPKIACLTSVQVILRLLDWGHASTSSVPTASCNPN